MDTLTIHLLRTCIPEKHLFHQRNALNTVLKVKKAHDENSKAVLNNWLETKEDGVANKEASAKVAELVNGLHESCMNDPEIAAAVKDIKEREESIMTLRVFK